MTATHIQANAKPGGDEPDEKNQKEQPRDGYGKHLP
jgi:hypothetical protein